jgi:thioester reductase-like protein
MKTYFVTGATGAIGSALVPILLEEPDTQVRLLIRAGTDDELDSRLKKLFCFWEIKPDDTAFRSRVQAVRGDTTMHHFGLSEDDFIELSAECSHIIHSSGIVRMNLPIEEARNSAVGSARNVIELARKCRLLEKVEVVSTVGVGGRWQGSVPERWLGETRAFHNTYEQAKAEAENYLHEEIAHEIPITIHRPSMVVGDSHAGKIIHFQVFYHLCEFLSGRRTLGLSPQLGQARIDIVPADYVARAIAWSSRHQETTGQTLHLCSGGQLAPRIETLRAQVRTAFSTAGLRLPPIVNLSARVFRTILGGLALVTPQETRRAIRTLPIFLDYLASNQEFDNTLTRQLLNRVPIEIPSPDRYIGVILNYYLGRRGSQREKLP